MSKPKKPSGSGRTVECPNPPGYIPLSAAAQPIFTFLEAASDYIQGEYNRLPRLHRYDSVSAEAHGEWERLHEEQRQQILRLGQLGAEAIRAGALANAAPQAGELVRGVTNCIRRLHGWVSEWWTQYGDRYRDWREGRLRLKVGGVLEDPEACEGVPQALVYRAIQMIATASQAVGDLRNRLQDIAIAIPVPQPAGETSDQGGAGQGEGGEPPPINGPDGPFGADGFRLKGVEVRFGRATLQYRLVLALWDGKKKRVRPPRPILDVMAEVWGHDHETEDATFRQLCGDARRRLEAQNFPLTIQQIAGKVQLSPL